MMDHSHFYRYPYSIFNAKKDGENNQTVPQFLIQVSLHYMSTIDDAHRFIIFFQLGVYVSHLAAVSSLLLPLQSPYY